MIEHADSEGRTLLHHAIEQKNTTVVEILLGKGCDVNREDKLERSYLSYAIRTLNVAIAQRLIDAGAEIENSQYMGIPLCCLAVSYNNFPLAQCVISGLQKQKEKRGEPLFSTDANPESNPTNYILHRALYPSNEQTILLLLSLGAPTSTLDNNGDTPLTLAVRSGSDTVTNLLLDSLPPPALDIIAKNSNSESPLHFLSHRRHNLKSPTRLSPPTIHRLLYLTLQAGGPTSISPARFIDKATPLHLSAARGDPLTVQILLSHGANTLAADIHGLTPLLAALEANTCVEHGQQIQDRQCTIEVIVNSMAKRGDTFLSRGDSLNLRICQGTALHFAARLGSKNVVQRLLEAGVDVLVGDATGRTALECALPLCNSRLPLRNQDQKQAGKGVEEECEEVCLILAHAMCKRGFEFSKKLPAIKGYKSAETTWLDLAALVEMDGLRTFFRECVCGSEGEKTVELRSSIVSFR